VLGLYGQAKVRAEVCSSEGSRTQDSFPSQMRASRVMGLSFSLPTRANFKLDKERSPPASHHLWEIDTKPRFFTQAGAWSPD